MKKTRIKDFTDMEVGDKFIQLDMDNLPRIFEVTEVSETMGILETDLEISFSHSEYLVIIE